MSIARSHIALWRCLENLSFDDRLSLTAVQTASLVSECAKWIALNHRRKGRVYAVAVNIRGTGVARVYLNFSDLFPIHLWVGATLAFSYDIDSRRLQQAVQKLVQSWPVLAGRLLQTAEGRYYIGPSGEPSQIPCSTAQKPHFQISDLPSKYAEQHISDACPSNTLLPEFIPQLQPHLMLTGKQALFQVQLTQVQDGCVLGISFSHGLSDMEGIGYPLADLACIYQGQDIPSRPNCDRLWLAAAALRGGKLLPSTPVSDQEIIASLPSLVPPETYADCVAYGVYDLLGCSAQDRANGEYHSAPVLHVPKSSIEKLRPHVLASKAAKGGGVNTVSANDIVCGILWLLREVANGNTLEHGLQKGLLNAADLRKNGQTADLFPEQYFGTAVGGFFCTPPEFHRDSTSEPMSTGKKGLQPQALYEDGLAAAVCAVRNGLEHLRADPNCLHNQAASLMQIISPQQVQHLLTTPELVPMRDAALYISNWTNMAIDNIDFGEGKAVLQLGSLMPVCTHTAVLSPGPHGDGLMCILRLPRDGFARVQQSKLLQHVAPQARFII